MTLCQRLCVQQVIEVGTGGESEKRKTHVDVLPTSFRKSVTAPTLCSAPRQTRTQREFANSPRSRGTVGHKMIPPVYWGLHKSCKITLCLHFPISLARTSLGFDLGDNTCAFCGPACREQDYEKLVKDKILQETIQYDIFRFLQPLSLVRAWKRVPEWKFTSCPSMSRP